MLPVQLFDFVLQLTNENEYRELKAALALGTKEIAKGGVLSCRDDEKRYVYLLCSGAAHAVRYAPDGREVDYRLFGSGDLLTEASNLFGARQGEYVVFADTNCTVAFFSYDALEHSCHPKSGKLLSALFEAFARQYADLRQRLNCLTCTSLREKILLYLTQQTDGEGWFEIPMGRSGLASYLFCDRTALCRELSRMKKEGLLDYRKNKFCILLGQNSKK